MQSCAHTKFSPLAFCGAVSHGMTPIPVHSISFIHYIHGSNPLSCIVMLNQLIQRVEKDGRLATGVRTGGRQKFSLGEKLNAMLHLQLCVPIQVRMCTRQPSHRSIRQGVCVGRTHKGGVQRGPRLRFSVAKTA